MLQDFHGRYYHPSNARFWFYGDDPADERLSLLSKYLDEFEARPVDSTVHAQALRQVLPRFAMLALTSCSCQNHAVPAHFARQACWPICASDCNAFAWQKSCSGRNHICVEVTTILPDA